MKKFLKFFVVFFFLLLIWAVGIEPRLIDTNTYEVKNIPNLPAEWKNKKIAFIADLQFGMWLGNEGTSERIVQQIIDEKPAMVLIGGDFVYHPVEDDSVEEAKREFEKEDHQEAEDNIRKVTEILKPLASAGIPVLAVLGNHDYGMEKPKVYKLQKVAQKLKQKLQEIGIQVLHNESYNKDGLYFVGIGPNYPEEDNVSEALSEVPVDAPRVAFMHNSRSFLDFPASAAPLAIAGHTHGGQVRIPFTESWSWIQIFKEHSIPADGWIQNYGEAENKLYVNRGIGFSKLPVRLNCRPELTYFVLK